MPNQLRRDPSRTSMLRNRFGKEMRKRFRAIADAVRELVVYDDAFGLIEKKNPLAVLQQVPVQAWRFKSTTAKVKSFRTWLQQQIDAKILTVDTTGKPWTAQYVESAYMKGANRAYVDVHAPDLAPSVGFYKGGMEEFLRSSFTAQTAMSEVEALYTRSFNELKGITDAMNQQMSRILTNGLVHGRGAATIARDLRKNIANITKTRAMVLARTEIVAAQAEGQLTAFRLLGVKKVGIFAEWLTAGDDKVCPQCFELEGVIMTIDQARGLIPRHPNCRCAWAPASKFQKQKGQIWSPKKRRAAMARSIQAERPNVPFAEAKRRSVWGGKVMRGVGGRKKVVVKTISKPKSVYVEDRVVINKMAKELKFGKQAEKKLERFWTKLSKRQDTIFEQASPTCTVGSYETGALFEKMGFPVQYASGEFSGGGHWWNIISIPDKVKGKGYFKRYIVDFGDNISKKAIETGHISPKFLPLKEGKKAGYVAESIMSKKKFLLEMRKSGYKWPEIK